MFVQKFPPPAIRGKQVKTVEQLARLANSRRAVVWRTVKPKAAAFVFSMQCRSALDLIHMGLYEYPKPRRKK